MTKISRIPLPVLVTAAIILGLTPRSAQADTITGSISFSGPVIPYVSTTGTGTVADGFSDAHSLVFGPGPTVVTGATGSFAVLLAPLTFTQVTMYSPLQINPPNLPIPASSPLWSVTESAIFPPTMLNTFTFTLDAFTEPVDQLTALTLAGTGIMSDGDPADASEGTWTAMFTDSDSTFSWTGSSTSPVSSTPVSTPEPGSGVLLLCGIGLMLLVMRKRLDHGLPRAVKSTGLVMGLPIFTAEMLG
jgi:hypothetical protein